MNTQVRNTQIPSSPPSPRWSPVSSSSPARPRGCRRPPRGHLTGGPEPGFEADAKILYRRLQKASQQVCQQVLGNRLTAEVGQCASRLLDIAGVGGQPADPDRSPRPAGPPLTGKARR